MYHVCIDGYLDYFQFGDIMNDIGMKIWMHMFVWVPVFIYFW